LLARPRHARHPVSDTNTAPGGHHVFVHIGEPKTGTSYLQQTLWENRVTLAAEGIVLPGYSNGGHARASQDLRETPRLASDPTDPWIGEWDVLAGQSLRARQTAVISNELLATCGPGQADRAVRSLLDAQVHAVVTVRDFAALLPAEWQESVKTRGTATWDDWLDQVVDSTDAADRRRRSWFWRAHDTLAILRLWSQLIPPDQVHVITVPRQGQDDELWLRFASVLGIDRAAVDLPKTRANTSLGPVETEFLRRMNEALPDDLPAWFYRWNVKRILAQDVLSGRPRRERLSVPARHAAWASEQAEIVAAGLRESGYHIVGDLDDLIPPRAVADYVGSVTLPAEELLDAAVHAAAALVQRQYCGEIVTSSGDLAASLRPVRPGRPGRRRAASQLIWTVLIRSRVKRMLYSASFRPSVRRLRILAWCVVTRSGRRR